ncbi:MAG TPA: hypothetical protein VE175_05770, partial [Woeseiaceae bacterium]|nr:hypothetical protein [Woeseiaceae bacterium]
MSEDSTSSMEEQPEDVLGALADAFLKDQPATAVEKVAHFLDSASDLANYLADRVAQDSQREARPGAIQGKGVLNTVQVILSCALNDPENLARHYARFARAVLDAVHGQSELDAPSTDRRFKDRLWRDSAFYRTLLQVYLAWCTHVQAWIEEQRIDDEDKRRAGFILEQLAAALAPSNLPINPAALRRAERSNGTSSVKGLRN